MDDLDGAADDLKGYRSLFHGPEPELMTASSSAAGVAEVAAWIERCRGDGIEEGEICVLARTNDLVRNA
ncbi:hypothetical protein QIG72_25925, partial [Klebsiella pneumoniae]|nr:hypothetical protein [Klebsiella pneumoniae]